MTEKHVKHGSRYHRIALVASTKKQNGTARSVRRTEHVARIGVVFGQRSQLWWDLPGRDSYDLNCHIYDIPAARFTENLAYLTAMLDMAAYLERPVRQLSLGQRMRAEIASFPDGRYTFEEIDVLAMDFGDEFAEELTAKLDELVASLSAK